jgi:hypothetical protein
MKSVIMIVVSLALGVGSTLLVQTVILPPPPVVGVACPEPDPDTQRVERALIDQAQQPLPVDDYVPQGRFPTGIRTGRE